MIKKITILHKYFVTDLCFDFHSDLCHILMPLVTNNNLQVTNQYTMVACCWSMFAYFTLWFMSYLKGQCALFIHQCSLFTCPSHNPCSYLRSHVNLHISHVTCQCVLVTCYWFMITFCILIHDLGHINVHWTHVRGHR